MQDPSNVSINIASFHGAPVPLELQRAAGGPNNTVMLLSRQLVNKILNDVSTQCSFPAPMYLTGPAGVGKSTILFMTAAAVLRHNDSVRSQHWATVLPVLLLYVADASNLIALNPEEAAMELCETVKSLNQSSEFAEVLDVLDQTTLSHLERWNQFCLKLRESEIKNLILVDQWNAITEASPDADHPLHRFSTIDTNIGFSKFVAAVSSSFTPIDAGRDRVFRDAEAECTKCRIEPWSREDINALGDIWRERLRSVAVDDTTLVALCEYTGGIPRLLEYFAATRSRNPFATVDDPVWRLQCTDYYVGCINSVSRNLSDPDIRKCFQAELVSLFLRHREWPSADSAFASRWLNSGLLVPDESSQFLVPANLFVRKAIDVYVANEQTLLLRSMYAYKPTAWRALELFFFLQLRKGNTLLTGTDLRNTDTAVLQFSHDQLQIIDVSEDFVRNPQQYLDQHHGGQPFQAGSLLLPTWVTHPVADAVLFVRVENYTDPQMIFVRVSPASYSVQQRKVPSLHPMTHTNWRHSVLQSYQIAFGITGAPNRDITKGKLPPNVQYVYATACEAVLGRSSQGSGHQVFLMRNEHIQKLNERLWHEMTLNSDGNQTG